MTNGTCPKCGGYFGEARYWKDTWTEALRHHCTTCGYHEDRPTNDQRREQERQRALTPSPRDGGR